MNQQLKAIQDFIQQSQQLTPQEKEALLKFVKEADKKFSIIEFKLDSTEKVKRTTAILLEETIDELEQKRKAVEAQNRELEIEKSLEKVRFSALAMKEPADMLKVCKLIANQLALLNVKEIRNIQTAIFYEAKGTYINYEYYAKHDKTFITETSYTNHEINRAFADKMLKGKGEFFSTQLNGDEVKEWIAHQKTTNVFIDDFLYNATSLNYYWFSLGPVALGISTYIPLSAEEVNLFKRFRNVFELAYRRFLDIEKAIAQAKEARVETALERVRAKTMAMHNSADVGETAAVMVEELKKLGIETMRCGIGIMHEPGEMEVWTISTDENNKTNIVIGWLDMNMHPLLHGAFESWSNKTDTYSYELKDDDLINYYNSINHYPGYPIKYDISALPKQIHHNEFHFAEGTLFAFSLQQLTENQQKIFKRFAGVFGQTYRRYLDLKKAEAQAKEAKIEAALERVRTKTMAMRSSNDIAEAVTKIFDELVNLGVGNSVRCGISIFNNNGELEIWTATTNADGIPTLVIGKLDKNAHSLLRDTFSAWKNKEEEFSRQLSGENLSSFYKALNAAPGYPFKFNIETLPEKRINSTFFFPEGALYAYTDEPLPEDARQLFKRFASAFSLTYRRYFDLQKAEAQAKEATIEAALEKVRSRTLAMQKSDELAETATVLFQQLIHLGIEPHRLYISILKDDTGNAEFWITDEDGSKISMAYEDNLNNNPSFKKMLDGWKQQKKSLIIDMQGEELQEYFQHLINIHVPFKGGFAQKRRLQYLAYFSKGFIGMASPDEQPPETLQLLERFAYVLNLTFTRFNDLKLAEAHAVQAQEDLIKLQTEKKRAEDALVELRAAQKQLIQSEKMASLGELTAGIAHEIQNPLNFVNNFSEVSTELVDELKIKNDEVKIEDDEVKDLINDIKQNLEKITHHGKRADAIVKGMLQHSRQSKNIKEPTDINALCDEYLRLSYHGLKAKDKSFNSAIQTNFDISIEKVNVIAQDVGRVILNILTNAFYAVNDKLKNNHSINGNEYKPLVTISTKKVISPAGLVAAIEIVIADNGNGIPQEIVDKIFHPFFTTKPTGEGTGLGLSLSYDIIKVHNGEIKVETKEGEGSKFIITLPNII